MIFLPESVFSAEVDNNGFFGHEFSWVSPRGNVVRGMNDRLTCFPTNE